MARKIDEKDLQKICERLAVNREGVSVQTLVQDLAPLPRRTIQRRLERLLEQRRIEKRGKGPQTKYWMPVGQKAASQEEIALSKTGEEIKREILRPLIKRKPVGYRREFLEAYYPNKTSFLTLSMKKKLWDWGRQPGEERPGATFAKKILSRLLIDLSWNSSRLEGNTYSLLETARLLELGESAEGKSQLEAQMILNHKTAIQFLVDKIDSLQFNRYTVCNLHALLSYNLLGNSGASGQLRAIPVRVSGTVYHPLEIPQVIEEQFDQILLKAALIKDPFEQAFFCMVFLTYLQAFEDVNKRTSRLTANLPLLKHNLCPLSFVELPVQDYITATLAVYELNRIELLRDVFMWAYRRSALRYSAIRHSIGEPDPFRLHHYNKIHEEVRHVVLNKLSTSQATQHLQKWAAKNLPENLCQRFVEVVETELINLHMGNIGVFHLSPEEFTEWKAVFKC